MRVLINREKVGKEVGFGDKKEDVFLLGDCDGVVTKLVEGMGWEGELVGFEEGNKK